MASTLRQTMSVTQTQTDTFTAPPYFARARIGNALPIAFGGIALSQGISAGIATAPTSMDLFSVQGSYLGPASTDLPTTFTVQRIRTTKTFYTCQVLAAQQDRKILVCLLDFHAPEPASMMTYSSPPMFPIETYGTPDRLIDQMEHAKEVLDTRSFSAFKAAFGTIIEFFQGRWSPRSLGGANVYGLREVEVDEPLARRTNSYWVRTREKLQSRDICPAMAFLMDGALAFIPLTLTNRPLTAASACSSLDFSLRFFRPHDLSDWSLHEQHTEVGAGGRTFSVGKMYDREWNVVAEMSQTSILRPPRAKM